MSRGGRRLRRWSPATLLAAAVGLLACTGLASCGGASEPPGNRIPGHRLTVYTSLPLDGYTRPVAQAVLAGERAALRVQGRIGRLTVRLVALDDATVARQGWDPGQTSVAAQTAVSDPTAVAYIGDMDSGASAVSIPLLNQAGIPQISPMSTAVGLTTAGPGAAPGEPGKYYPSGRRTFAALAPNDASQADAQVRLQRSFGCARIDVLNDESFDGYDAAASFGLVAHAAGLDVVGSQSFDPRLRDFGSLAASLAGVAPNCVLLSAMPGPATTILAAQVASALPHARLFAAGDLGVPSFADPAAGGVPARLDSRMLITVPGWSVAGAGRRAAWNGLPAPAGLYGYEAMRLVLAAIRAATDGGKAVVRRTKVQAALLRVKDAGGPLGPLSLRRDGTSSLRSWAVMRINGGALVRWTGVTTP